MGMVEMGTKFAPVQLSNSNCMVLSSNNTYSNLYGITALSKPQRISNTGITTFGITKPTMVLQASYNTTLQCSVGVWFLRRHAWFTLIPIP